MNDPIIGKSACFYNFYPHYRSGFIKIASDRLDMIFYGSPEGISGINSYKFSDDYFRPLSTYYLGRFIFQPAILWISIFGKYDNYIFLANPNFVCTWIAALICRLKGRKVIFWGHGFSSTEKSVKNVFRSFFLD